MDSITKGQRSSQNSSHRWTPGEVFSNIKQIYHVNGAIESTEVSAQLEPYKGFLDALCVKLCMQVMIRVVQRPP